MASIIIPSSEWVDKFKLKQTHYLHLRQEFIKNKVAELANKMIVDPIRDEMDRAGVSRKIWETVTLKDPIVTPNGIFLRIHSEYFADNGFDVALAREKGTDMDKPEHKHWVRPKDKKSLKWIEGGKARFSGGHKVSGLPRLNIIQKTIEQKRYDLQQKLQEEHNRWKQQIFSY